MFKKRIRIADFRKIQQVWKENMERRIYGI